MTLTDKLFTVEGEKTKSLLITHDALLFSSQSFETNEEFNKAWGKTLSLATKAEIKYASIKSVSKEDSSEDIVIKYKGALGMPQEHTFSFSDKSQTELFNAYLEKEQRFNRTQEQLSPAKATMSSFIALIIGIAVTVFSYYQALAIANGNAEEAHSRKSRSFYALLNLLGDKGVLLVGGIVVCFFGYKVYKRFTNPPQVTRLVP